MMSGNNPVRAEHVFPPTQAVYTPRAESHGVETHSRFCLKPLRGSGVAFGSRAPYGAGRLRRRPRFARQSLASLGLVEFRTWLSFAVVYSLCSLYSSGGLRKCRPQSWTPLGKFPRSSARRQVKQARQSRQAKPGTTGRPGRRGMPGGPSRSGRPGRLGRQGRPGTRQTRQAKQAPVATFS